MVPDIDYWYILANKKVRISVICNVFKFAFFFAVYP